MPAIALTGNFGMGKSTVLNLFQRLGAHTVDIDDIVHDVLTRPSIVNKISKALGTGVLSRRGRVVSINKKRTAEMVFNDPEKRHRLERIIHPEVLKEIKRIEIRVARKDAEAVIIFEIPLLFEAGYERNFDKTITVHTTRTTALKRLSGRGFSKDNALKRMSAQMPISRKMKMSDFRIDNNGSIEKTGKRVQQVFRQLLPR